MDSRRGAEYCTGGVKMAMLRHPLSGTEYHLEDEDDCRVRVVGKTGVEGHFSRAGVWIAGERRTADAAMAQWVANAPLINRPLMQMREPQSSDEPPPGDALPGQDGV